MSRSVVNLAISASVCVFVIFIGWHLRIGDRTVGLTLPSVLAQSYQLNCPANSSPWTGWQTYNGSTGQYLQWGCIDRFGNVIIGKTVYAGSGLASAFSTCPSTGCTVYDGNPETWNSNPFASLPPGVSVQVNLLRKTWITNVPIVLPSKSQIVGAGRGDPWVGGTVLRAGPNFPADSPVIEFASSSPAFGVRISNLLVDCNNKPGAIGVRNANAQEQSGLNFVTIHNCPAENLLVTGATAQNSGPYRNLEIYNDAGCTNCNASTIPVEFGASPVNRGLEDVTINSNGTPINPSVALEINSSGTTIRNIHIEGADIGVDIGAKAALKGLTIDGISCGPGSTVPTCINIAGTSSVQGYVIINAETAGGTLLIDNQYDGPFTSGADEVLSLYAVGVGATRVRPRFYQGDSGITTLMGSIAMVGNLNMNGNTVTDGTTSGGISVAPQGFTFSGISFANLPASANGTIVYCRDCMRTNPCTTGGVGAFAKRLDGTWACN